MTTAGATFLLSPEKTRSVCHLQEGLSFSQRSPLALGPYMLLYTQSGEAKPPTFLGSGGRHVGKGRVLWKRHTGDACPSMCQRRDARTTSCIFCVGMV